MGHALATLGGGCFWCTEAVFLPLRGVLSVVSGYAGGHTSHPSYEAVCQGTTGHAEVIQISFDPAVISYETLLQIFFATHDPTTPDRQGNDVGSQYRSVVFTHSEEQAQTAQAVMASLEQEGVFADPIVTEVEPLSVFWPAEDYHQNYFARNPLQPYCRVVVSAKVAKFRQRFTAFLT